MDSQSEREKVREMPVALYTRPDVTASASFGLGVVLVEGATFEVRAIRFGSLADAQNQEQGASYEPLARGDRITMVNGYFEYQAMREELRSSLSLTIRFIRVPRAAPMSTGNKFGGATSARDIPGRTTAGALPASAFAGHVRCCDWCPYRTIPREI